MIQLRQNPTDQLDIYSTTAVEQSVEIEIE
jgi:hypothetical protein